MWLIVQPLLVKRLILLRALIAIAESLDRSMNLNGMDHRLIASVKL